MNITKHHVSFSLLSAAFLLCVLMSGGLHWHYCLVPLVLVTLPLCFYIKNKNGLVPACVSAVCIILMFTSLFFTKTDFQTGLYETEKTMLFFAVLLLSLNIDEKKIMILLMAMGTLFALVGILGYCGVVSFSEIVFVDRTFVRLQSFMKYANTAACFLFVSYFACLRVCENKKSKFLYLCSGVVLLSGYLTFSKACIPMFLVLGTLLVAVKKEHRAVFAIQNAVCVVMFIPIMLAAKERMTFAALALTAACVVLNAVIPTVLSNKGKMLYRMWLVLLSMCAVGGVAVLVLKPSLLSSLFSRSLYSRDALKLIKEYPLLGVGPSGWRVFQYSVQSAYYHVTYLHNGILQFVVENGLLFTGVFVALIVLCIVKAVKKKRQEIAVSILLVCLHSVVDFDLSFGSVLMLFGMLCGCVWCETANGEGKNGRTKQVLCSLIAIILLLFQTSLCVYMTAEYFVRQDFEAQVLGGNTKEAHDKLVRLEKLCPRDSLVKLNFAAIYSELGYDKDLILQKIKESCELSPHDPSLRFNYLKIALDNENAYELCMDYLKLDRKNEAAYKNVETLLKKHLSDGSVTNEVYERIISDVELMRISNGVENSNDVLRSLMKKNITK